MTQNTSPTQPERSNTSSPRSSTPWQKVLQSKTGDNGTTRRSQSALSKFVEELWKKDGSPAKVPGRKAHREEPHTPLNRSLVKRNKSNSPHRRPSIGNISTASLPSPTRKFGIGALLSPTVSISSSRTSSSVATCYEDFDTQSAPSAYDYYSSSAAMYQQPESERLSVDSWNSASADLPNWNPYPSSFPQHWKPPSEWDTNVGLGSPKVSLGAPPVDLEEEKEQTELLA